MPHSLLNSEDRELLSSQKEAVRRSLEFMVSDLFYPSQARTMSLAYKVLIWFKGRYITADDLLRQIEESVPHSQIFEQFQASVYDEVQHICRGLPALDSKALIMVAGFESVTEDEIRQCSEEAVREARDAIYGPECEGIPF